MTTLITPAGLGRRLAAAFYDLLLLIALWILIGFIALLIDGGEAVPAGEPLFRAILLGVGGVFCTWFWTHGGQTLGMRAWRLQVRRADGGALSMGQAWLRFSVAIVSWASVIGVLWCLLPPGRKNWQDLASGTETVLLPKPKPPTQ